MIRERNRKKDIAMASFIASIYGLNIILIIIVVFFERKKPSSTLIWIMGLLLFPLSGFIFYLFVGQDMKKRRLFDIKRAEEADVLKTIYRQKSFLATKDIDNQYPGLKKYLDDVNFFLAAAHAPLREHNTLEIITDGEEKFKKLFQTIEEAISYIHVQYYILRNDDLGRRFLEILAKKAKEGVEVKVIIDGIGGMKLPKDFFDILKAAGGECTVFYPAKVPCVNFRLNYRNHRKICVIDGMVGYVGGFNVGEEYLGKDPFLGYWRDTHLKIIGEAVESLEFRFLLDWRFATKKNYAETEAAVTYYYPSTEMRNAFHPPGKTLMQIVSSGPDSKWNNIHTGIIKMVHSATDHIYIQSPYLIPDTALLMALQSSALSGIDIRIMVPDRPDHPFVYAAASAYIGELLEAGVKVYRYHKGFMHSKMAVIDGFYSTVGTTNLDIRSFQLNFEVNAFIYDEEVAGRLEEIFFDDLYDSTELTLESYKKRSRLLKVKESLARLLSPLL